MVEKLNRSAASEGLQIERRVFGITTLDTVRASTFLREVMVKHDPTTISDPLPQVPVIGGHSGETIMPLFSLAQPFWQLSADERKYLVHRVQFGGDEIVKAKKGLGSATLSMAHAAFKETVKFLTLIIGKSRTIQGTFYISLLNREKAPVNESARKLLPLIANQPYFSVPVTIEPANGYTDIYYKIVEVMDKYERNTMLPQCLSKIGSSIEAGVSIGSADKS